MEYLENCSSLFDCPRIPHYIFGICWDEEDRQAYIEFNNLVKKNGEKYKRHIKNGQYHYKKIKERKRENE